MFKRNQQPEPVENIQALRLAIIQTQTNVNVDKMSNSELLNELLTNISKES